MMFISTAYGAFMIRGERFFEPDKHNEKDEKRMRQAVTKSIFPLVLAATAVWLLPRSDAATGATPESKRVQRDWAKTPLIANQIAEACQPIAYAAQRLDPQSYLGGRVDLNFRTGLLHTFDVDIYLNSYGQNPKWPSGEYLGKFMQGLSAMYLYTGEPVAKERLDKIIATWRRVQAPDGWLGTTQRFKSWDIWEHKYVLLGLVDYHALTGGPAALEAARKIGDMMCANIGPGLGDIMQSGHWALGSASILEPMVYLYRCTGERKYLGFCEYIVESFEGPTGPKLISIMTTGSKRVCDVEDTWANRAAREIKFGTGIGQVRNRSKGYEMLSCIIGLARMYQLTGKPEYLNVAVNAWQDITANRLCLAGSSGADECFKDDHCLPAETSDSPAEGCVTAHWIFLSRVLFEITGEARYADAVENALYNYLLASQRPQDCHQSYNTGYERHEELRAPRPFRQGPRRALLHLQRHARDCPHAGGSLDKVLRRRIGRVALPKGLDGRHDQNRQGRIGVRARRNGY